MENLLLMLQVIFAKGAHYALASLAALRYDVVGLDWTVDPIEARSRVGANITLQGNFDPCGLYASPEKLDPMVKEMVEKFGRKGWIANLGHGIYPDTDPDHVEAFISAVHKHTKKSN